MVNDWNDFFEDKCFLFSNKAMNFFIKAGIEKLSLNDSNKEILKDYVNGPVSKPQFNQIRDSVISSKLGIDRNKLDMQEVKEKTKECLLKYFLLYILQQEDSEFLINDFSISNDDWMLEIIENIVKIGIENDVIFKVDIEYYNNDKFNKVGRFISLITKENQYHDELSINYHNIFDVFHNDFIVYDPENEENTYSINVKDIRNLNESYYKFVEANIEESDNSNVSWNNIENELYLKTSIKYFTPENSWEEYLVESYRLYKQTNYKLAFLQAIIALESFIEFCIFTLKNWLNNKLANYIIQEKNLENVEIILSYLVSDETEFKKINDINIRNYSYYFKKINDDSRNLINNKLVDLVNFNILLKSQSYDIFDRDGKLNNLFDGRSKYLEWFKENLNKLIELRNILAHGDAVDNEIDFMKKYHIVISAFLFLIMEFRGEKNTIFLDRFCK